MDFLFDLPILGFVKETYAAYIIGILKVSMGKEKKEIFESTERMNF